MMIACESSSSSYQASSEENSQMGMNIINMQDQLPTPQYDTLIISDANLVLEDLSISLQDNFSVSDSAINDFSYELDLSMNEVNSIDAFQLSLPMAPADVPQFCFPILASQHFLKHHSLNL